MRALADCAGEGEEGREAEAEAAEEGEASVLALIPRVLLPALPLGDAAALSDAVGEFVAELLGMDKGLTAVGDSVEVVAGLADCESSADALEARVED